MAAQRSCVAPADREPDAPEFSAIAVTGLFEARLVENSPAASTQDPWVRSFGRHWRLDLAAMALMAFLFGAVRPLADPDLPMHLVVGEWIVKHRAVPFVEPFAWT